MDPRGLLRTIGFHEGEVKVYLALAELGKSTASLLAKRIDIPRTTAYSILDKLSLRGVVSEEHKGATTFFAANPPKALLRVIQDEKEKLLEKENITRQLVSLIEPYFKSKNFSVPKLQFFEGKEGVNSLLYEYAPIWKGEVLKHDGVWWGYQDHTFVESYRKWLEYYWEELKEPGEKIQLFSNIAEVEVKLKGEVSGREIRPLPKGTDFASTVWVLGEYIVLIMSRQKPHYAYQLRDPIFSQNLRSIFQMLWGAL